MDGHDPCRSRDGVLKERWPSWEAAWYVVELCLLGQHGRDRRPTKMYAYSCKSCFGYHLASCKNAKDRREHDFGMARFTAKMTEKSRKVRAKKCENMKKD